MKKCAKCDAPISDPKLDPSIQELCASCCDPDEDDLTDSFLVNVIMVTSGGGVGQSRHIVKAVTLRSALVQIAIMTEEWEDVVEITVERLPDE